MKRLSSGGEESDWAASDGADEEEGSELKASVYPSTYPATVRLPSVAAPVCLTMSDSRHSHCCKLSH